MKTLKHFPLFAVVLIIYNLLAIFSHEESSVFGLVLFSVNLVSGAALVFSVDTMMILFGVIVIFIELVKATRSSAASALDHGLSTLVFIVFLLELILVKNMGTPGFLILTTLSLLDVIAGFTVTINTARRDFAIGRELS